MMNSNNNKQMVKRRIYSFQMDGESGAEAILRAFQQYTLVDWALYISDSIFCKAPVVDG